MKQTRQTYRLGDYITHDNGVRLNRVSRFRTNVPLLDIVNPRGRANAGACSVAALVIGSAIVGLIIGWVTAPFGIVPT